MLQYVWVYWLYLVTTFIEIMTEQNLKVVYVYIYIYIYSVSETYNIQIHILFFKEVKLLNVIRVVLYSMMSHSVLSLFVLTNASKLEPYVVFSFIYVYMGSVQIKT